MFQLLAGESQGSPRMGRRDWAKISAYSALGMGLTRGLHAAESPPEADGPARRCIYIFLCGGPSQLDMWDPKPQAPKEIRGPFKPISTSVPGMQIGDLLPLTAQHADKFALIRSMNHDSTSHDIGILRTLLASKKVQRKPYPAEASDHPALGAILSKLYGPSGTLPPWIVAPRFFMTGTRFYKGQTAGFLGGGYEPFELGEEKKDSLGRTQFNIEKLDAGRRGVDPRRFQQRRRLLSQFQARDLAASPEGERMGELYQRAFSMFSSSASAFDVTREPRRLRERYGLNEYGQSFLLARRLIETGVRMVNVFWTFYGKDGCQFNLWDNHGSDKKVCGGANKGLDMIKHDYCCPSFDRAYSALLSDLADRGLLEDTLVVVVGEFGRTPKINKWTGRDHWGSCYSAVLAGGGVQGGAIYGRSDKHAAYVVDAPVSPFDLHATVLHAFGVPPEATVPDPTGRPIRVTDGAPVTGLF